MLFCGTATVRISLFSLVVGALMPPVPWAMASGARGSRYSDTHVSRQPPSVASSDIRNGSADRHSHQRSRSSERRRPTRIIVVPAPTYYYSPYYFLPASAVVNASFFCIEHSVGFISRVGLLDHLGGTHKFALEHAAAICPAEVDTCVFDSMWPLY